MINYKIVSMTPEYATELMKGNVNNRKIRQSAVNQFAKLITEGKWCRDADVIRISKDKKVLDGQHRLSGIIKANIAVEVAIAYDVPDDAYKWMNVGIKRTAYDRIHLVDNDGVNRFACSINNAYIKAAKGKNIISIDMVEDEFLKMSDSFVYVASCFVKPSKSLTVSPVGAAFVCYHNRHPIKGVDAMDKFISGSNLEDGDSLLLLREALLSRRLSKATPHELYWKTIHALYHHMNGTKTSRINCSTEDFNGNIYDKLVWKRTAIGDKAAETKAERVGKAS